MKKKQDSFSTMKRKEYGKRGGLATVQKHGKEHMRTIGKRGAATFHKRYKLQPVGLNDFAIVKRSDTRVVIGFLSGRGYGK